MDSSEVLRQMALLLAYFRAPASGTFLNLGSGTCQAPRVAYGFCLESFYEDECFQ